MNAIRVIAIVLIVGGIVGLAYGGFSYTRETHNARIGPMEFSITDTQRVNIPLWAGVAAIVAGGFLLIAPRKLLPGS